jgi:hypothetical protein
MGCGCGNRNTNIYDAKQGSRPFEHNFVKVYSTGTIISTVTKDKTKTNIAYFEPG